MSFWNRLFKPKQAAQESSDRFPADIVGDMGLTAARMAKAGLLLNNAQTPAEGRAAMYQAGDILGTVRGVGSRADMLRNTDDLADDQILPLCKQMAASLAQQARDLAKIVEEQGKKF